MIREGAVRFLLIFLNGRFRSDHDLSDRVAGLEEFMGLADGLHVHHGEARHLDPPRPRPIIDL